MPLRVIVPPDPAVSLEDAKQHLRVDHGDDDTLISALLAAAQAHIDGPAGWLGRSIGVQTLEWTTDRLACRHNFGLPYPPFIGSFSLKYFDAGGIEQTIDPANYRMADGRLWFNSAFSFPATLCAPDAVRLRWQAGYNGVAPVDGGTGDVPAPIVAAILLMTGALYANREASSAEVLQTLPFGVEALLSPYRIWSI